MGELLAKSPHGTDPPVKLLEHTRDVMDAAEALFGKADKPTRLGECWLRFFRLPEVPWAKFHGNLLAACGLHDWGKANDGFQKAVRGQGQQAIRHEHFSALLIAQEACWKWLGQRADLDREVILSAVLTHHLKAGDDEYKMHGFPARLNGLSSFRSQHATHEFGLMITAVAEKVTGLPASFDLSDVVNLWVFDPKGNIYREQQKAKGVLDEFQFGLEESSSQRRLLHAVRSALIIADAAGSGLRRVENLTRQTITDWIRAALEGRGTITADEINSTIINERVNSQKLAGRWIDKGDGKDGWTDFQLACDNLPSRALLLAPCGSGKTLAAWRWVAARACAL